MHTKTRGLTALERFWAKVDKTDTCWLWTGYVHPKGYGRFYPGGGRGTQIVYAHRFSFELAHGPMPEGMEADHLCRVRHCVNPEHLEAVTRRVNLDRRNEVHGWKRLSDRELMQPSRQSATARNGAAA
jgi:hypothetical protein